MLHKLNYTMHKTLKALSLWIVLLPAAAITWFIVWLDRKLKFKLPFPRDVEELAAKKDWLIAELKKNNVIPAEAVVTNCEVKVLNPELIFRSNAGIIKVQYTANGGEHELKCFAKFAPIMGTVWNRAIFNLQLNHIKEADFNNYFVRADKTLPAPKVYTALVEPVSGNLCLITEFMDGCREYEVHHDFPQEHLDMALNGMAELHALYWNNTEERMKKVHAIEDKVVYFMDSVVAGSWSTASRKILVQSWLLMNQQQTVLHGDSRIGNMMFPAGPNGRYVLIDWQAVRKGKALYDIAYFLVLSLPTEHLQRSEQQSLQTYYNSLLAKGVTGYSYAQLQNDYKHACLCVLVLLSLPLLSGESSIEGEAVKIFSWGMNIWRERMQEYFKTFDYAWVSKEYGITETEARNAVAEMLKVIDDRLRGMKGTYVK
jgi:thiamine kinase-like enzyme